MSNEDETVWVIFNGEIYNHGELRSELLSLGHHFRSRSDTEVLVHGYEAWGIDGLLSRIQGMFAFALRDKQGRIYLVRDPLGIKPLYYAAGDDSLIFASELNALRSSGEIDCSLDDKALLGFLLVGSVPSPLTILHHARCLPPGSYLCSNGLEFTLVRYWRFRCIPCINPESVKPGDVLRKTVEEHLISDVPVGVFLSGGVDSTALVALASRQRRLANLEPLRTITISFDESSLNEGSQAQQVAEHFQTLHHDIRITGSDFISELPNIFDAMDQPTNDGVNTYFVAQAANRLGLKVVLSGLGGDEIFFGYRHYRWLARWGAIIERTPQLLRNAAIDLSRGVGSMLGKENLQRLCYLRRTVSPSSTYLALRGFFAPLQIAQLLGDTVEHVEQVAQELFYCETDYPPMSPKAFQYMESKLYLPDQLLRDSDVFSMRHSVELRVPFLHRPLVEQMASYTGPPVRGKLAKPLLVNSVDDPMTTKVAKLPKKGFTFPIGEWMRRHDVFFRATLLDTSNLNKGVVESLFQEFKQGRLHWSRAWALFVVSRFLKSGASA